MKYFLLVCLGFSFLAGGPPKIGLAKDKPSDSIIESLSMGDFADHYETPDGLAAAFDALMIKANLRINDLWRIELRHFRGTSPFVDGFQVSVGDFEGRVAHRLDNPNAPQPGDSPGQNVYGWLSWRIWSSKQMLNNVRLDPERDEGLGLGVTRDPHKIGLSYWYTAGLYPSVRTSLAQQANAFSVEAGGSYQLAGGLHFLAGYRYQAIRTNTKHARGQEQGVVLSLQGRF